MQTSHKWTVTPGVLDISTVDGVGTPDLSYWGCLGPFLALVAAVVIGVILNPDPWLLSLIPAALLVVALRYVDKEVRTERLKTEYQDRLKRTRQDLVRRAEWTKKQSIEYLHEGEELTSALHQSLDKANQVLDRADFEFNERAFGPFWDAVETAAVEIGKYRDGLDKLAMTAERYQRGLAEASHTFPTWQEAVIPLGAPSSTLSRFEATVRQGQTDYEFSSILEQRLTREVLIQGFKHLGDALSGLNQTVQSKFSEIQQRIDALSMRRYD